MLEILQSRELFMVLLLASKFVWLYFSGKYTVRFLVEFTSTRMVGIRSASVMPLVLAILWACFLFAC
ncbi:hypothetical protein [Telluribacter sp.]|uniref:hypothetical protein n=1 Tax=Telluribacter sp. TaxID=1978767 RepID=UPI002E0F0E2C|nr:hypothetical protein [Telluribacter sp.]